MKWLYAIVVQTCNICNLSCRMDATLEKLFLGWIRNHLQNLGQSFFQGSCKKRSLSWKSSVSHKYPMLFPYCMMPCVYLLCCSFGSKCQSSSFQLANHELEDLSNCFISTYETTISTHNWLPFFGGGWGCLWYLANNMTHFRAIRR